MAIQLRRGDYADFDPSQLLDGELAVVLENDPDTDDGTGLYVGFGDDNVKRVAFADEAADVPIASSETAGIVAPDDDSFYVDSYDGTMHLNPASDTTLGGVQIGEYGGIGINSDDHTLYVKLDGTTITTDENDQLTAVGESAATSSTLGVVMPDGETIDVDSNGVISVINSPTPSSTAPQMDGTASAGSSTDYARGDHVHPTDTSRASAIDLSTHTGNGSIHVSTNDRATWNAKADESDLTDHVDDETVHITSAERTSWNGKADASDLSAHAGNTTVHVTAAEKSKLAGIGEKANGYYTTETVNGDRVLTLVYDLVEE